MCAGSPGRRWYADRWRISSDAPRGAEELSRSCLMIRGLPFIKHFFTTRAKNLNSYGWNRRKQYIWARWCKRKLKAWGQLLGYKYKIRGKKTVLVSTQTHIHSPFFRTNSVSKSNINELINTLKQRVSQPFFVGEQV